MLPMSVQILPESASLHCQLLGQGQQSGTIGYAGVCVL